MVKYHEAGIARHLAHDIRYRLHSLAAVLVQAVSGPQRVENHQVKLTTGPSQPVAVSLETEDRVAKGASIVTVSRADDKTVVQVKRQDLLLGPPKPPQVRLHTLTGLETALFGHNPEYSAGLGYLWIDSVTAEHWLARDDRRDNMAD
jgi:hypothetical protein